MTELQGAVALAQLERVEEITSRRNQLGTKLNDLLREIPGVSSQHVPAGCWHSYFLYFFKLDLEQLGCTAGEFATALAAEGIPNEAHLITGGRPAYLYDIFQNRSAFPGCAYLFGARPYRPGDWPAAGATFHRRITTDLSAQYTERGV